MPVAIPIALAAAGILASLSGQAQAAKNQKDSMLMKASEQQAAPWLAKVGASPGQTQIQYAPSLAGSVLQGGLGGYGLAQNIDQAAKKDAMDQALLKYLTGDKSGAGQSSQAPQTPGNGAMIPTADQANAMSNATDTTQSTMAGLGDGSTIDQSLLAQILAQNMGPASSSSPSALMPTIYGGT